MSRGLKLCLASLLVTVCIAWFGRTVCLSLLGQYLIGTNGVSKSGADVVVVPAADYIRADVTTETLVEAAELVREGRVRHVLMSCAEAYGISECELAQKALQERGYLETSIEWLVTERLPDQLEAEDVVRRLKQRGAKSAIILLPNYKGRRLGGIYCRLGAGFGIAVNVSSQKRGFDPRSWWRSREGQTRCFEELARLARVL